MTVPSKYQRPTVDFYQFLADARDEPISRQPISPTRRPEEYSKFFGPVIQ